MEEISTVDYLTKIPDELKMQIFSDLNAFDVIQLTKIQAFDHLSLEKKLISNISFCREYRFQIDHCKGFLSHNLRSALITTLNINCVYWIPITQLRHCLKNLKNVKHLYAVDTRLSLGIKDCALYRSLKHLRTLAVTYRNRGNAVPDSFPTNIVNLYFHIEDYTQSYRHLLPQLKDLQELWIIDSNNCTNVEICSELMLSLVLKKMEVTVMFPTLKSTAFLQCLGRLTFENARAGQLCLDLADYEFMCCCQYRWKIDHLKFNPFDIETTKKVTFVKSIQKCATLEELNLTHSRCNKPMKEFIEHFLLNMNLRYLKKLSLNICAGKQDLFEENNEEADNATNEETLFKKPRLEVPKSILEKAVEVCPLIEELELWQYDSSCLDLPNITETALGASKFLVNLTKLTLDGMPVHLSGEFLVDICRSCHKLESLRIRVENQNSCLNKNIIIALRHAEALKDFRYEAPQISINKIMQSFNEVNNSKLERLVLKCKYGKTLSVARFESFLCKNAQLRLLCLFISTIPYKAMRYISNIMKKYKVSPQKVFFVAKAENRDCHFRLAIPYIHRREMLECHSNVSVLDLFNGFVHH